MFRRKKFETEMSREIEAHLRQATEDYIAQGLSAEEASFRARREFGAIDLAKEELRDTQGFRWLADFWQDARYTARTWRRNPGFAAGVIAVLALGLGSTTALFSALDRILFRPAPYADPERLVSFGEVLPGPSDREIMMDRAYFQLWHPVPEPFESITSVLGFGGACDLTEERPERLSCARVEANFFSVLGTPVALGRDFMAEEDRKGSRSTAILTHALWQRRFAGDPTAVGKSLQIDGKPVVVVGVLPSTFESPLGTPDLFLTQQLLPVDPKQNFTRFFTAIGRLKPGVTPQQAQAAIAPLIAEGDKVAALKIQGTTRASVRGLRDLQVRDASRAAWLVLAASGVFLLIVCVNATGLLLARFAARTREFEMRAALGASRMRLARLALSESLLLSIAAGGFGLALAWGLLRVFLRLAPTTIPKIAEASLDLRVFAVAAALSLGCGIAIGLWPALSTLQARTIGTGSRSTTGLKPRARFALISTQVAMTVTLLGCSGLLLHSLWKLVHVPLGFEQEQTFTMAVTLNVARYPTPESQSSLFEQVLERVRQSPGSLAASWSNTSPFTNYAITSGLAVDGNATGREGASLRLRYATPGYFETFRIPILSGRVFVDGDRNGQAVAILSEDAAQILFPGQNAIGHTIRFSGTWHAVVGVAGEVRNAGLTKDGEAEVYLIQTRQSESMRAGTISLRTALNPADARGVLQQALADADTQLPSEISAISEQVAVLTARPRFLATLLAAFAGLALVVSAAGLYAVTSFLVTQRTRDIGVRMALGARPADIAAQMAAEAGLWIAAGIGVGYGLAQLLARTLQAELFGIAGTDPWSWVPTVVAVACALLVALLPPMRRARRVDPAVALRAD